MPRFRTKSVTLPRKKMLVDENRNRVFPFSMDAEMWGTEPHKWRMRSVSEWGEVHVSLDTGNSKESELVI